jgi:hypothetical protein
MTKLYLLNFSQDLGDVARIGKFLDTLPQVIDWRSDFPNCVAILAFATADELSKELQDFFEGKGRHLLAEVRADRQGLLPPQAWNFFNQSPEYDPLKDFTDPEDDPAKENVFFRGMSSGRKNTGDQDIDHRIEELRDELGWAQATGSARKWWKAFEEENARRKSLVLRLMTELVARKTTITKFFLAYVYSNVDNIQANLLYLDYVALKEQEQERKRKEAAIKKNSSEPTEGTTPASSTDEAADVIGQPQPSAPARPTADSVAVSHSKKQ